MSLLLAALLCAQIPSVEPSLAQDPTTSVVIVLLDDVGFDLLEHTPTPNLDSIRDISARYVGWSNPVCSPTRACLASAQYGFRTGVLQNTRPNISGDGLGHLTPTIADWVGGKSAWLGKWHIASQPTSLAHPANLGFDFYAVVMQNLGLNGTNYFNWTENINAQNHGFVGYATTKNVDFAVRAIGVLKVRLVVVSPYAAHKPRHVPPSSLHTQGDPDDALGRTVAALEAFDTEFGRMLFTLGPEDYLIVTSDNGTESDIADDPRSKGTVYQGGVSVPVWISGPGIDPGDRSGLVDMVDLGPTALELLGLGQAPTMGVDGVSFAASVWDEEIPTGRNFSYTEKLAAQGIRHRAIRDETYKLIRIDGLPDEFYDLVADPTESNPLPANGAAWQSLSDALTALSGE